MANNPIDRIPSPPLQGSDRPIPAFQEVLLGKHYSIGDVYDRSSYWTPNVFEGYMPINSTHKRTNGVYLEGGGWWATKRSIYYNLSERKRCYSFWNEYDGKFGCDPVGGVSLGSFPDWEALAIIANDIGSGNGYLAGMSPVLPSFGAASSLYELKDTPGLLKDLVSGVREAIRDYLARSFIKSSRRKYYATSAGQWHLAIQFGWLPILGDIRKFVTAHRDRHNRLKQLIRNENRPVKRSSKVSRDNSVAFNTRTVFNHPNNPNMFPTLNSYAYGVGNAVTYDYRDTIKETWFEGQARYLLPPGPRDLVWNRKMMRRIMGARVTPDAIWAVMPWSWLVDYFLDVSSFLKATSNGVADNLIWDYAYIMRTYTYRTRRICSQFVRDSAGFSHEVNCSTVEECGWKFRTPATLFGFGVLQGGLSPHQLGILGALGLSRIR